MKVAAVIVSYNSGITRLRGILTSLVPQCDIVVADNSDDRAKSEEIRVCTEEAGGSFLSMGGNRGIAAAQNAAIEKAFYQGADAVLLLDDDSTPADDLVAVLVAQAAAEPGTVFGAVALDMEGQDISNARHLPGELPRCRDMMSSGTLIPRDIFLRVGRFDESLFIDCVDYDWGWRAQDLGIPLRICRRAKFSHSLGEGKIGGMRFPSPRRHYYQYRNILRMMVRPYVPLAWRMEQIFKLPTKLVLIAVLLPDRWRRLQFAFAGIRDVSKGQSGYGPSD